MAARLIKNAGQIGINIEKTMKDAEKNGLSPVFAVLHAIEKKTKNDKYALGKLITNTTAASAVRSILREMGFVVDVLDDMRKASGSTMNDYTVATDNAIEASKRLFSTLGEGARSFAAKSLPSITRGMDSLAGMLDNTDKRAGGLIESLGSVLTFMDSIAAKQLERLAGAADQTDILTPLIFGKPVDERTKEAYQEYARTRKAAAICARHFPPER